MVLPQVAALEEERRDHDDAIKNLSTLSPEELRAFVVLLRSCSPRFEVHMLSRAYPLLEKGILKVVRNLDGLKWLCEFHPAIVANRDNLLPGAEAALENTAR